MSRPGWITAVTCLTAGALMASASAQTPRSGGGGGASAQLLQEMQQLASERTTLQAENDKLKSQLAAVTKDRDALKSGQQTIERRAEGSAAALAHSNSEREATEKQLTEYRTKMQELIEKFRETVQKLREAETGDAAAKQSLAAREHELSVCVDRNVALYQLNNEVLTRMDAPQGVWSHVAQAEPFTRIKRVQNENLVDDYRIRAQEQKLPTKAPTAASGNPPATQPAPEAPSSPASH